MDAQQRNSSTANEFDSEADSVGYHLNRMCFSFLTPENCQKFKNFPEAYCQRFKLNENETHGVTDLDVLRMLKAGGNIAYLAHLTRIYDIDVFALGAQQCDQSPVEFAATVEALNA